MKQISIRRTLLLSTVAAISGSFFETSNANAAGAAAWQTCYFGAQIGVGHSKSDLQFTNSNPFSGTANAAPITFPGAEFSATRGIVGGQIGCNYAIADSLLFGVEGSWISNPMNQHQNTGFFPDPSYVPWTTEVITTNIQSVYALNARLGLALSPDLMIYGKGGLAGARIQTSGTVTPAFTQPIFDFDTAKFHLGWTAGIGIEYRLFRNVTIGAEYSYYRFANVTHTGNTIAIDYAGGGAGVPANPVIHRVDADMHAIMARINFGMDPFGLAQPSASFAQAGLPGGEFSAFVNSEAKYSSWTGSRGANVFAPDRGRGYQVYTPTTIGIDYLLQDSFKLESRFKGGYVYSSQGTFGQRAHYEGPIDTQASFNLTFLNFETIRPLLGLSLNLPTGNTYLPGNQRFTRMDADLVEVGSYGTGFNINPTAGFILGVNENTAVSFSAGYTWQGDFTKEGISITANADTFDLRQKVSPGESYTLNGNISSTYGNLVLIASAAYVGSSEASLNGVATGRAGAKFNANGTANYRIDEYWALSANIGWSYAEKNEIPNGFGGLILEPKNSNSNVFTGSFEPSYMLTERLKLAVNYSFLYRDNNYYDPIQEQFSPAKRKHLAGASATYAMSDAATITVRGSHSWIKQDDSAYLVTEFGPPAVVGPQPPSLKYHAWAASIGGNLRF